MCLYHKHSWEGPSNKLRVGGPGFESNSKPCFSFFLKHVLQLGSSTNIHDLGTYFFEHMLHVSPYTHNKTLNYPSLRYLCSFGADILPKACSAQTLSKVSKKSNNHILQLCNLILYVQN